VDPPPDAVGRPFYAADRVHVAWSRSLVAGINAHFRHRETLRPEGDRVLEDPFAALLAEDHLVLRLLALLERLVPAVRRTAAAQATAHNVRHASIDALVRAAVADGFGQVVLVGAGYDMRAARIGGGVWFEVDQPAVAARKERLLAGRPGVPVVARVALDVRRDPLGPALVAAGWNPGAPTCFVVEGLVHYLARTRVETLLAAMATPPAGGRRRVVMSYIDPGMSRRVTSVFRELVRLLGEIPRTYFTAAELGACFAAAGLGPLRSWDHAGQVRTFAPAAVGRPAGLTQEVAVAG
jgi:methyltransferase (TIGR00027 family)